jgi:hypothetical protein
MGLKVGVWNTYPTLNYNNYMFTRSGSTFEAELFHPMKVLYEECLKQDVELISLDLVKNFEDIDIFWYIDLPDPNDARIKKAFAQFKPNILFLSENEVVAPINYDKKNHDMFCRVYTFRDDLVDNVKYFKMYLGQDLPESIVTKQDFQDEKLCTLINACKLIEAPNELYSRRIQAIQWFQTYQPQDFDLYGRGWTIEQFPSFKGEVENKKDVYAKYKFCICFENSINKGYITEKIFDCFKNGIVPIYWGADNVADYIPEECFIDIRRYDTYEEIYSYLKIFDESDYNNYINAVNKFLASEQSNPFKTEYFVQWMIKELKNIPLKKYLECFDVEPKIPHYEYKEETGPLVSVIIPTYIRNRFLKKAVQSVLDQTMQDFEIIVINDGGEKLELDFNDQRIIGYDLEKNSGVSSARNEGIRLAKGKYICFLDSDDYFFKHHLKVTTNLLENSNFDLVYTDSYRATLTKEGDWYKVAERILFILMNMIQIYYWYKILRLL